jgi:spore maturation protein CgeB
MVVAPGSVYSTFDTYVYYLDAFGDVSDVSTAWGFSYHNVIEYHRMAREAYWNNYQISLGDDSADIARASRELITEIVLRRPDVLFFIDGSKYPPLILAEIRKIRTELKRKFLLVCYITEAPYIDSVTDRFAGYFDILFTNEKNDVDRRDPEGKRAIYYLPHSYSPSIHYQGDVAEKYKKDVFFCGTIFPERGELISKVNWDGVDALICGAWALADDDLPTKLGSIASTDGLPNSEVAEYYRGSRISLNFNRTFGWTRQLDIVSVDPNSAYSVGPRVIEAAACGAFILSEPRPELLNIFGDSIPTFSDAGQLETLIRYYLENESERKMKAIKSTQIVQNMTYLDRAKFVNRILLQALDYVNSEVNHG